MHGIVANNESSTCGTDEGFDLLNDDFFWICKGRIGFVIVVLFLAERLLESTVRDFSPDPEERWGEGS